MKPDARQKLNQAIELIQDTGLGSSLLWLWVWDTIKYNLDDDEWDVLVNEEEAWDLLVKHVDDGVGFTMEYGSEALYEHVRDWMVETGQIKEWEEN